MNWLRPGVDKLLSRWFDRLQVCGLRLVCRLDSNQGVGRVREVPCPHHRHTHTHTHADRNTRERETPETHRITAGMAAAATALL